ncbi:endonuclease/exonuclease/phosphatase family protein [Chthonobacter rhizosphaerae]|uniref:endonuclease/exonuclease/phosphatase family protein n=1 Tax=Chthonobacter rhizosphaerae TaxID=2735553 RepID=UPI0015EE8AC0|nr:endonuclease/exonuclease/phosphatase family protein [Chthonobacter rhizosphaerae]
MRVMTWNLHSCIGCDGRRDPDRIARCIGAVRPDILAVQEVDIRPRWSDPVHLLDLIGEQAGVHRFETWTMSSPERDYGIAILSRWPLSRSAVVDLAYRRREPRRAIDATVETPEGPVRVVSTHFGLTAGERSDQVRRLLKAMGPVEGPTIALGDFNDWFWPGAVGRAMAPHFPSMITGRTFPARFPVFPLDRIFLTGDLRARRVPVDIPWVASDHLAVVADVSRV